MTELSVFLSYAHANKLEADAVDKLLQLNNIKVVRDIRDLKYGQDIQTYMQSASKYRYIVIILSDQYLRSVNCMKEALEVLNSHHFSRKTLPIVLDNAKDITDIDIRARYFTYWKEEICRLTANLKTGSTDVSVRLNDVRKIEAQLQDFIHEVCKMRFLLYSELRTKGDQAIIERIKEGGTQKTYTSPSADIFFL